ncbi:15-hydroxyprostaglandin dehydrogenase [NAD(+)]-like, partial [Zootermopsis nevadensis]|uniref:15-hydroxyprostaglandin dehydrogenase [NAD(+)]-like n=1 Tax=Zootermopsis nevadensis TaxID=136037 RepID=UPI000B8E4615
NIWDAVSLFHFYSFVLTLIIIISEAFKETINKFGNLDIVVNNAGLYNEKKWKYEVAVSLNGVIHGTLMALKYMDKSAGGKGGIVVNMSSIAGLGSETYVSAIHNATQSAVIELSRAFGSDNFYQTTGVRVMVICPGYTESEIIPHDQQQLLAMLYKDEWVDDFYNLIQRLSPQQK